MYNISSIQYNFFLMQTILNARNKNDVTYFLNAKYLINECDLNMSVFGSAKEEVK